MRQDLKFKTIYKQLQSKYKTYFCSNKVQNASPLKLVSNMHFKHMQMNLVLNALALRVKYPNIWEYIYNELLCIYIARFTLRLKELVPRKMFLGYVKMFNIYLRSHFSLLLGILVYLPNTNQFIYELDESNSFYLSTK